MSRLRLVVPDLISPSYFPAIAAVELGFAAQEGLSVALELRYPVTTAARALRAGEIDFLAGSAHAALYAFPEWAGARLLTALSQHTYWFLVMHRRLGLARGDLASLAEVRIGAAPGPDLALHQMLRDAGVDPVARNIQIAPVPGAAAPSISFGLTAYEALAQGRIDGFWANGMGAQMAVRQQVGTVVVDARRGDGPAQTSSYTFPALIVTERLCTGAPAAARAMGRAVIRAQEALRATPELARQAAERRFPPTETELISELIRRDAPFYQPEISPQTFAGLDRFARAAGLAKAPADYHTVVAAGHGARSDPGQP